MSPVVTCDNKLKTGVLRIGLCIDGRTEVSDGYQSRVVHEIHRKDNYRRPHLEQHSIVSEFLIS